MPISDFPCLVLPIVNLNGTIFVGLEEDILTARTGVCDLLKRVETAQPNGRDYYPQGPDAYRKAADGHNACALALSRLSDELYAVAYTDTPPLETEHRIGVLLAAIPAVPVVFPTVHTNGTSAEVLIAAAAEVFREAQSLIEDFRRVKPDARNYADYASCEQARSQHAERVALIKRVGDYHLEIAKACKQQSRAP